MKNLFVNKTAITLLILLLAIVLAAVNVGAFNIDILSLLLGDISRQEFTVIYQIRLPRILLACFVGASLAISGSVLQSLFRNSLADPSLIGISSGAALAIALAIVLFDTSSNILGLYTLSLFAFIGAFFVCILIFSLSVFSSSFSVVYILLCGIAINALAVAIIGLLTYFSSDQQLRNLVYWTLGSFSSSTYLLVIVCASVVIPSSMLLLKQAPKLNLLLLGQQQAEHLGIDGVKLKKIILVTTSLNIGVAVAVSGIIGFIGLVVPHIVRLMFGADNRILLPLSMLLGAIVLVVADTISRVIISPAELPVGIVTCLIGAPFFLWLLLRDNG